MLYLTAKQTQKYTYFIKSMTRLLRNGSKFYFPDSKWDPSWNLEFCFPFSDILRLIPDQPVASGEENRSTRRKLPPNPKSLGNFLTCPVIDTSCICKCKIIYRPRVRLFYNLQQTSNHYLFIQQRKLHTHSLYTCSVCSLVLLQNKHNNTLTYIQLTIQTFYLNLNQNMLPS